MAVLTTPRLILRHWRESDLEPFAALNADPETMQFMAHCLAREESDALARRAAADIERRGWGLWAVEAQAQQQFIGCVGLAVPAFRAHFTPCVEIAWRLVRSSWGRGYATEGARACLAFAFQSLGLVAVVAFTVPANLRSRAVMERLGMRRDARDDFDHPQLPAGHALSRHVLYRLSAPQWAALTRAPSGG